MLNGSLLFDSKRIIEFNKQLKVIFCQVYIPFDLNPYNTNQYRP